ncbi:hypothetical protein Tco_0127432 [Tanacetum coccineum]
MVDIWLLFGYSSLWVRSSSLYNKEGQSAMQHAMGNSKHMSDTLDEPESSLYYFSRVGFLDEYLIDTAHVRDSDVDSKEIVITESSVRRDLQLADEEGVDCLPNSIIFEQLALMGIHFGLNALEIALKTSKPKEKGYLDVQGFELKDVLILFRMFDKAFRRVITLKTLDTGWWRAKNTEDEVWNKQQGYKVLSWKLYDSCGVHSLRMQCADLIGCLAVEYPLTPSTPYNVLQ